MGASLSIKLTQKSKNETARTAVVGIQINVTSTAGTHNHFTSADRGAVLTLTIDGNTSTIVTPFGSEETGTFTTTIYSRDTTVSYDTDGTKTVNVSATLATGTSSGTTSKTASITLTPISASGGGSSGGNEGGNTGGGSGSGNTGGNTGGEDEGEDMGAGSTGSNNPSVLTGNVTVVGQRSFSTSPGSYSLDTAMTLYPPGVYNTNVIEIKITTPKFIGISTSLGIDLNILTTQQPVRFALCSSNQNYAMYKNAPAAVNDPHQIASGSVTDGLFTIKTTELKSETDYYLFLWIASDMVYSSIGYLYAAEGHSFTLNYTAGGTVHIETDSGFETYEIYIDTDGTGFKLYAAYMDNGTAFELYH